jgi:phenylalanyl-tRNA synthetase beta chain
MWVSCNWLGRHVDLSGVDLDDLSRRFTLAVAELEGVERVGHDLSKVVVGHVRSAQAMEGTKLTLCDVDTGEASTRSIVCGAPNVAAGQRVPVAVPGTTLGEITIAEREVQGQLSQGMIASEAELGLSDDHAGIMVLAGDPLPGTPLPELFDIEDTLFEIDNKSLTHRPDLWGHRGIAREIAALLDRPLLPLTGDVTFGGETPLDIQVDDAAACPRYTACTLDGLTIGPSPLWLRLLLHRVGVRSINNVVDATNFVMLDLGNPLHAFDRREIKGDAIRVRRATDGEVFATLDEVDRILSPDDLLICDGERPVALAGIMGGHASGVADDTRAIVLEAATFDASVVRMTSQKLGLRTDSSARFEKCLDPRLPEDAAKAFASLVLELSPGATVTSALQDVAAPLPETVTIGLRLERLASRLGMEIPEARVRTILSGLDFGLGQTTGGTIAVTVPSYRATKDIAIEMDLVEEVGRVFGYDNIPPQPPRITLGRPHPNHRKRFERASRAYLARVAGLDEVMTYSFATDPLLERIDAVPEDRLVLRNAISAEMPGLRTTLGPNLLGVLGKNERTLDSVRIFELGRVFLPRAGELPHQPAVLGVLVADLELAETGGFCLGKGLIAGLARAVERPMPVLVAGGVDHPWAHPVRQARLTLGGAELGYVAELHPATRAALGFKHGGMLLEIDLDAWRAAAPAPTGYTRLARFPAVFRDFAVVVDETVRAGAVQDAIAGVDPQRVEDVIFHSEYRGEGVEAGQKCLAWSVTFRAQDGTLDEDEVRGLERSVWAALTSQVSGKPRV